MFPGCSEHCNAEGTLCKYSRNIACQLGGKYRSAAHSVCNLKLNKPYEIPVFFHNGSNYDYNFIIKELANEFQGKLECVGENCTRLHKFSCSNRKRNYKH